MENVQKPINTNIYSLYTRRSDRNAGGVIQIIFDVVKLHVLTVDIFFVSFVPFVCVTISNMLDQFSKFLHSLTRVHECELLRFAVSIFDEGK